VSRKRWIVVFSIAAVAITSAAWSLRDEYASAQIATASVAKQACSCVHVSGRALEACLADLPPEDTRQVAVSQIDRRVTASVLFGVVHADAAYEDGYGCQLTD
jgi:hypothetical protein